MMARSVLATLSALILGCGGFPTIPEVGGPMGSESGTGDNWFSRLLVAGCRVELGGPAPHATAIRVPEAPDKVAFFDCRDAQPIALGGALAGLQLGAPEVPTNPSAVGGTWIIVAREWCRPSAGYWQADGTWYLPTGASLHDCQWIDTFIFKPAYTPPGWSPEEEPIPFTGAGNSGEVVWPQDEYDDGPRQPMKECPADTPEETDGWNNPTGETFDPNLPDPEICTSAQCMQASPGVWMGSWPIPTTGGVFRHTAISTNPPMKVVELMGWTSYTRNSIHNGSAPAYGGTSFAAYKWVKVAGPEHVINVTLAIAEASAEYSGNIYSLGSNRFVGSILRRASIHIGPEHRKALGRTPGICWCGACDD